MRKKVSIIGAGNVGATAAHWIASKELADVVLIDVVEGIPQGKALDLAEAMPIEKRDVQVIGANDYAATANSDIVVITAGIARKPGMSRDDLLNTNYKIMSDVVAKVVAQSPESILIVVSNPLMPWLRQRSSRQVSIASASSAWPACWIRLASARSLRKS
jgi:malate dehydrogenase